MGDGTHHTFKDASLLLIENIFMLIIIINNNVIDIIYKFFGVVKFQRATKTKNLIQY